MSAAEKYFFDPASLEAEEENPDSAPTLVAASEPPPVPGVPSADELLGAALAPTPLDHVQAESPLDAPATNLENPVETTELASQFSDPVLFDDNGAFQQPLETNAEVAGTTSLLQETTEAVHELVGESIPGLGLPEASTGSHEDVAKAQLAARMFDLVMSEYKFDVLCEEILRALMASIDGQAGSILELDEEAKEFMFRAVVGGSPDKVKSFRVPAYKGIVGHVAESRQSLLINDLEDDDRQLRSISVAVGFEAKSCIAAPIIVANKLYGVIEVFNKVGINYFDAHDQRIVEDGIRWAAKVLEVRFFAAALLQAARKK